MRQSQQLQKQPPQQPASKKTSTSLHASANLTSSQNQQHQQRQKRVATTHSFSTQQSSGATTYAAAGSNITNKNNSNNNSHANINKFNLSTITTNATTATNCDQQSTGISRCATRSSYLKMDIQDNIPLDLNDFVDADEVPQYDAHHIKHMKHQAIKYRIQNIKAESIALPDQNVQQTNNSQPASHSNSVSTNQHQNQSYLGKVIAIDSKQQRLHAEHPSSHDTNTRVDRSSAIAQYNTIKSENRLYHQNKILGNAGNTNTRERLKREELDEVARQRKEAPGSSGTSNSKGVVIQFTSLLKKLKSVSTNHNINPNATTVANPVNQYDNQAHNQQNGSGQKVYYSELPENSFKYKYQQEDKVTQQLQYQTHQQQQQVVQAPLGSIPENQGNQQAIVGDDTNRLSNIATLVKRQKEYQVDAIAPNVLLDDRYARIDMLSSLKKKPHMEQSHQRAASAGRRLDSHGVADSEAFNGGVRRFAADRTIENDARPRTTGKSNGNQGRNVDREIRSSGATMVVSEKNQSGHLTLDELCDSSVKITAFRMITMLGKGSYAIVKLAQNKQTGEEVALKIYDKLSISDTTRLRNVKREIYILKRLSHPNIIRMHCAIHDRSSIVLVMEYTSRTCLNDFIKKRVERLLSEQDARFIMKQLASGIEYMHTRDVIHRDIKMDNILIDDSSRSVKIIDFGFSICSNSRMTIYCGTPTYMAPEIVSKLEYCGKKADIWALGIVLYVMLTGKFPFRGRSDAELFKKIQFCSFEMPASLSKNCSDLLKRIIQINPSKRPTANEILSHPWLA